MTIQLRSKAINIMLLRGVANNHWTQMLTRVLVPALLGQLIISSTVNATTLSEAVNNQLATISTPCKILLGGDLASDVLTGGLFNAGNSVVDICERSVPFGTSPQGTIGSANSGSLPGASASPLQQSQGKEKDKAEIETQLGPKWTVFMTAEGGTLNRDISTEEAGFDSQVINLLVGSTYAINATNTLSASASMRRQVGDYIGGGDFTDETTGWRLLEIYQPSAQFFIQAVVGVDTVASQRTRVASFDEYFNGGLIFFQSGTPSSDYRYKQSEFSLQSGYTFYLGSYTLTPQLGLSWLTSDYGTYSESSDSGLALTFHNDKRKSQQSSLGLQVAKTISTGRGVMIPQVDVNWKHEFADDSRQVDISFVDDTRSKIFTYDTQAPDRDFVELGGGIAFVFINGVQTFARLQTVLGQEYTHSTIAAIGLNIEF